MTVTCLSCGKSWPLDRAEKIARAQAAKVARSTSLFSLLSLAGKAVRLAVAGIGLLIGFVVIFGLLASLLPRDKSASSPPPSHATPPITTATKTEQAVVPVHDHASQPQRPKIAQSEKPTAQPVTQAEWRTWTDASGKHKTEAQYQGTADGKVKLLKRDGSVVRLSLEKLSAEDCQWVADQYKPTK